MARAKKTWKLVLTSVILSILILVAFTAVFIRLIVPAYNITREQIYSILTKALPILIGLVLIEIALVSSKRGDNDYSDNIDKLSPNAYDSPLYTAPIDDPSTRLSPSSDDLNINKKETAVKEVIKEVPVEVVKEVIKEVPVEVVREVPVEVEVVKEVPVEVVKEVVREVPVEVIKEVTVEKAAESEVIIRNNYIPVEIKVPEEVVVEKTVEKPVEVKEEEVYLSFKEALKEEMSAARSEGYPLTLVALKGDEAEKMEKTFEAPSFFEDGVTYAILPYTRKKDVIRKVRLSGASLSEMDEKSNIESMLKNIS